jgi:ArsR family transcriptional regulator, lead/cadmium/zinc/bismuth-responsive transcriptional repressor
MDLTLEVADLFRALADPTRTRVVHALLHQEMTTSGLAALLEVNPPAVSQHLRVLRALRIVRPRREGQLVYYALDDEHIRMLITLIVSHLRESRLVRNAESEPDRSSETS